MGLKLEACPRRLRIANGFRRTLVGLKRVVEDAHVVPAGRFRRTLVGLKRVGVADSALRVIVSDEPLWG